MNNFTHSLNTKSKKNTEAIKKLHVSIAPDIHGSRIFVLERVFLYLLKTAKLYVRGKNHYQQILYFIELSFPVNHSF